MMVNICINGDVRCFNLRYRMKLSSRFPFQLQTHFLFIFTTMLTVFQQIPSSFRRKKSRIQPFLFYPITSIKSTSRRHRQYIQGRKWTSWIERRTMMPWRGQRMHLQRRGQRNYWQCWGYCKKRKSHRCTRLQTMTICKEVYCCLGDTMLYQTLSWKGLMFDMYCDSI